ncbi:MAG: hypothetical protein ACI81P_000636 [Neolewinella sp.]
MSEVDHLLFDYGHMRSGVNRMLLTVSYLILWHVSSTIAGVRSWPINLLCTCVRAQEKSDKGIRNKRKEVIAFTPKAMTTLPFLSFPFALHAPLMSSKLLKTQDFTKSHHFVYRGIQAFVEGIQGANEQISVDQIGTRYLNHQSAGGVTPSLSMCNHSQKTKSLSPDPHNNPIMKRFFFTIIYSLLVSCAVFANGTGGEGKVGTSLFDQWNVDTTTEIELHINFDTLEDYRKKVNSLPALIIQDGNELELNVTVRGKFRRKTCAMPPMMLQFKKAGLRALGLNTHNDFKLVTHCTNDEAGQDALLREQLAYEMYNTVNPAASFRTQLLTITYVNTADGSTITSYAILIEDTDELRGRLNMKNSSNNYNVPVEKINNAETLALFQYMIGNSDYGTKMVRNMKLFKDIEGTFTAVPYDFDFSGLVNASYAGGMGHLNETKVTDRTMLWDYDTTPDFTAAADYMTSLKDTLFEQVDNFDNLSSSSKREITKYIKGFYKDLKHLDFRLAK